MLKINKIDISALLGLAILYSTLYLLIIIDLLSVSIGILLLTVIYSFSVFFIINNKKNSEANIVLLIPIIITAFQNIYLGMNINKITSTDISFFVIINYLFSSILLFLLMAKKINSELIFKNFIILVFIIIYGGVLFYLNPSAPTSFLSGFRNITSPIIFFMIGVILSMQVDLSKFYSLLRILFLIIFFVGIYERFIDNNFWLNLNIGDLWAKKGIFYNTITGKPYNHLSAEIILGQQQQRMVSTFAEPVNLGTFFVLFFHLSWWKKKYLISTLAIIGCILTVSKGALLGILLLGVVYTYYKCDKRTFIGVSSAFAVIFMAVFVFFNNAGGSVAIHVNGLIHSFTSLFQYPMGIGIGNAGVYGNLFAVAEKNMIQESGLGVIIAQLGFTGLIAFIIFFVYQYKSLHDIKSILNERVKILAYTMIFSFILLILFSESALGPNSSAGYMMVIGVICGKSERIKKGNEEVLL